MRNDRLLNRSIACGRIVASSPIRCSFKKVTKNRRHGNETITFFFFFSPPLRPARINDAQWRLWETFVPLPQNLSVSGHHVRKNTLPFSSFFALLPRSLFFQRPPCHVHGISFGKMCCFHGIGVTSVFFFFFFLDQNRINPSNASNGLASSCRKFVASRN